MSAATQKKLTIDAVSIEKANTVYRSIYHSLRLNIINLIHRSGTVQANFLVKKLKLEKILVSQQLRILREAGFINSLKQGNAVFYSINYTRLNRISMLTDKLVLSKTRDAIQKIARKKSKPGTPPQFTPAEMKVLRLVCDGYTSAEIGKKLKISTRTAEDHRSHIMKKMRVKNSVRILLYSIRHGLVTI